jgi:hypothetical protein
LSSQGGDKHKKGVTHEDKSIAAEEEKSALLDDDFNEEPEDIEMVERATIPALINVQSESETKDLLDLEEASQSKISETK